MKLNEISYCHKNIRKACADLAKSLNMYMETNLSEEFKEIKFYNLLGYVVINWQKETVFCLGHKLNKYEFDLIRDIMLYCNWLELGSKFAKRQIVRENRKAKRRVRRDDKK